MAKATKTLYVAPDVDRVMRAGAARLQEARKQDQTATLTSIVSNRELNVREALGKRGIRLMKRRSYTERTGDKYWVMIGIPLTLSEIEARLIKGDFG